jgi:hypothetical protein
VRTNDLWQLFQRLRDTSRHCSPYLAVMPASLALSPFGQTANTPPDLPLCVLLTRDTTVYSSCEGILTATRHDNDVPMAPAYGVINT